MRSLAILSLCICATAARADAPAQTPKQFLDGIYAQYIGKDAKGVRLESHADIQRLFAPELAKAIIADRDAAKGEVGNLDGDPFVDAQDWGIASVDVSIKDTGADKAVGTVRFKNLDVDAVVTLELIKRKSGWRVREITSGGHKLSDIVRGK